MTAATVLLISAAPREQAEVRAALMAVHGQPYQLEVVSPPGRRPCAAQARAARRHPARPQPARQPGCTSFLRIQPKATNIPIVALVGEQDEDIGNDVLQRGALDFLRKDQVSAHLIDKVLRYATERTHTLLALKASEQRYRELFQNVTAGVFQTTPDGKFMAANPALVRMLGYDSEDELLSLDVSQDIYFDPEHRDNWVRIMAEGGEVRNAELLLKRKDGTKIVVLENSRSVRDAEGRVLFYEGTLTDITAAHELSQQLSYDASHDPLTGLANRREFELRLQRALEMTQATGATHAVCFPGLRPLQGDQRHLRATWPATSCCGSSASSCSTRCAPTTWSHASAATSSACCCTTAGRTTPCRSPTTCSRRSTSTSSSGAPTPSVSASASDWSRSTAHFKRIAQVMNAADTACYAAKDAGRGRLYVYQEDATLVSRRRRRSGMGGARQAGARREPPVPRRAEDHAAHPG